MKSTLFKLSILFILLSGCTGSANYDMATKPELVGFMDDGNLSQEKKLDETITKGVEINQNIEKKIIKTAEISIEVKEFKSARASLEKLLKKHKAYVSNERQSNYDYEISSTFTIRLLSENFDSLLNEISGLAHKINTKEIQLTDVTEEFIDVTARLKNKKQVEQQYLELLKKAYTIDDILKVTEHLRNLREEIESKEGRLKYLKNQVSYSTISLYMYERSELAYTGFGEKIIEGLEGGWKGILAFVIGLTYIWPLLVLIAVVIWFLVRRMKKKKQNTAN